MASGGEISVEDAVNQLHQMFGDYDKAALAAVLEVKGLVLYCASYLLMFDAVRIVGVPRREAGTK